MDATNMSPAPDPPMPPAVRSVSGRTVGIDAGGTFTDVVTADGVVFKIPSTPAEPHAAVAMGMRRACAWDHPAHLAHGTTVATNALIEHKLARTALIATTGFADVIEIARQDRPSMYDERVHRPTPLVPRSLRFEVSGRLDATGAELEPLELDDLIDRVRGSGATAVAVCLLHADLNPAHERLVGEVLRSEGFDVTCSHEVSPEFREYERTVTTVINAGLRERCAPAMTGVARLAETVTVMSSSGGTIEPDRAATEPVRLLVSGPAGGVYAALSVAAACDIANAVSLDMGGTSTDCSLIRDGRPSPSTDREVHGYPVRVPSLDIRTIGAGGGSVAWIDSGGSLRVGPESAGARPGPACYGLGGAEPTVTDAQLLTGRLGPAPTLPGIGPLSTSRAEAAFLAAEIDPDDVLRVAEANMVEAVRELTLERGFSPNEHSLIAFGGAGPIHACAVADALDIRRVVIPDRAGVLCAYGLLLAPRTAHVTRSWVGSFEDDDRRRLLPQLVDALRDQLPDLEDSTVNVEYSARYFGQHHELPVSDLNNFHAVHQQVNGYSWPDRAIEVVAVRAAARAASAANATDIKPSRMDSLRVAATCAAGDVVVEADTTIVIAHGWRASLGPMSHIILDRM